MKSATTHWYRCGFFVAFVIFANFAHANALSQLAGFAGPCGNPKAMCICNMATANGFNASIPVMPTAERAQAALLTPVRLTSVSPSVVQTVNITSFAFTSNSVTIPVGSAVQWTLVNGTHTTTSDTAVWDSGILPTGNTFTFTFNTVGDYTYHCTIHSFMTGVVHVQAVPEPTGMALIGVFGALLNRRRRKTQFAT